MDTLLVSTYASRDLEGDLVVEVYRGFPQDQAQAVPLWKLGTCRVSESAGSQKQNAYASRDPDKVL